MIELIDVGLTRDGRTVLSQVSLVIRPGDIVGLIGPPEAGKSSLLKVVAGLLPPTSGELRGGGEIVRAAGASRSWRARIGMAFQNDALFDALTVFDNVAYPLRRRGLLDTEIGERVWRRLEDVGLREAARRLPGELSGGMRKRTGIARATIAAPEIGLFDDPVAGLDPVTGGRILDLITSLARTLKMGSIVVANDLPVLLPVCTAVLMLHRGQVVFSGSPQELLRSQDPLVAQFVTGADAGPL